MQRAWQPRPQTEEALLTYGSFIQEGTLANIPSSGVAGRLYFATDANALYYDTGTGLQLLFAAPSSQPNTLINGGFNYAQRQAPATLTTVASDAYSADRYRVPSQTASVQYQRTDNAGVIPAGLHSEFYGTFKQITGAGKFMVCQPMEGRRCLPLIQYGTVTFQCMMKASSSKTIRLGMVYLNSSGTLDTIPAAIVPTTWGANSTDPTLGTNLAYQAPSATQPPGVSGGTISGNAVSCTVGTTWGQYAGIFSVPTSAQNLIPIIWTDSQFSVNDTLSTTEWMLTPGQVLQPWLGIDPALDLVEAERFCYVRSNEPVGQGIASGTTAASVMVNFPVQMRVAPSMSYSANVGAQVVSAGPSLIVSGLESVVFAATVAAGLTASQVYQMIPANANARMVFNSEL